MSVTTPTFRIAVHAVLVVLVPQHLRQQRLAFVLDELGPLRFLASTGHFVCVWRWRLLLAIRIPLLGCCCACVEEWVDVFV